MRLTDKTILLLLAMGVFVTSVRASSTRPHPAYNMMVEAARRMKAAEETVYSEKLKLALYDPTLDPNRTGLIGVEFSQITSTVGSLKAKRTATNPDFAAYIVRELVEHGFTYSDSVVITMTGSFPGLNLAVILALETLDIPSLRICSMGASSYGANQPEFTWLHIEDALLKTGLIRRRTDYVTLGASGDVGRGLPPGGKTLLRKTARKMNYPVIKSATSRTQAEERRRILGAPEHYSLLINIGGNQAMLGKDKKGRELPGGWIEPNSSEWPAEDGDELGGILFDFLRAGVPVLNLLHVEEIAGSSGIPSDPQPMPRPGETPVYFLVSRPVDR